MKKMDVRIKASNERDCRVLREINRKAKTCMKEAGKQQNAKKQNKMDKFCIILFFTLVALAILRVTGPIVVAVWRLF